MLPGKLYKTDRFFPLFESREEILWVLAQEGPVKGSFFNRSFAQALASYISANYKIQVTISEKYFIILSQIHNHLEVLTGERRGWIICPPESWHYLEEVRKQDNE